MTTALQSPPPAAKTLTYEAYMAEEEIIARYDIINGERIYMAGATDEHQDCEGNLFVEFREFGKRTGVGKGRLAPRDILIRRSPLRTRQPDVYFISAERIALNPAPNDPAPLIAAPELVVEIISDSETKKRFGAKMADYCAVGVEECWKVMRSTKTVEVLRLSASGPELVRVYGAGETVQSITFPGLTVAVDAVFAV